MRLSDAACRNAKPNLASYSLSDGLGLFLAVTPSGGKLWRMRCRYEGKARLLALSSGARALLVKFSDVIETAPAPGGNLSHVTGYASKAAEQACRIAGVITLWGDLNASEISFVAMANGIDLVQFYLSEASRLADTATISAEITIAETLRKWLLTGWKEPEVLVRDVMQRAPSRVSRESPKARAALAVLEKHGWLVPLDPGTVVRGAARNEAWRIVRGTCDVA